MAVFTTLRLSICKNSFAVTNPSGTFVQQHTSDLNDRVFRVLEEKVRYYEVLHSHSIKHRAKRSADHDNHLDKASRTVMLSMFNQTFICHLQPRTNFFSPTFRLVVMNNGQESIIHDFQKDQFLVGTCNDNSESEVHGYFVEGVFTGTIKYGGVVYAIEEQKGERGKMIAYRSSDIIWDKNEKPGNSFCGVKYEERPVKGDNSEMQSQTAFTADQAGVMERVDAIFRNTVWNIDYEISGMGFELAEMKIETNASNNGYNAAKSDWDPLKLLQAFGHNLEYKKFCVAHLFTYEKFDNNVLGLAYIAPTTEGSVGGMCSLTRFIDGQETALNTGWSSSKDSTGETVLTRQAELVTAHGHNWGAEHDPDTSSCSPSAVVNNGKYLMYAYSVTGYDTNNDKFSPCSRRDIGAVLAVKAQKCFSETPENTSCGNGLKDDNEECDAGYIGRFGLDPCCTKACRFSNGSVCRKCILSLICSTESESCQRCCRVGPQAECTPYIPMSRLPNGRPCVVGYCLEGACKKTESSVIQRLFDVFENLTVDGVLDFFRKNVVGCIIVFSLIFWIPISCCVSFQDRKKRNSLIQEGNRELQMNREFLYDEDGRKINRPQSPEMVTLSPLAPPVMSPQNKEVAHSRNRVMPLDIGGIQGSH
ncbi:hypothetical protein C0Q70_00295 [Pomacea canaliculata]|uniref:Peptidase M12B domain-containing protein n=1 Tax=Pomacea canaliculata TaxID=400727 RepID=A0A2T7PW86_POMCA|nr:hypothetical protein C0Q70_00295 [Pomacea canaliculata]